LIVVRGKFDALATDDMSAVARKSRRANPSL
jgi:hypothetical protein